VEVGVLQFLNKRVDPEDKHHIVRMLDCFLWRKHLCLVFELLSVNLYELLKHNHFKGLSLGLLAIFIAQVATAFIRPHA
jgi:dual specificity protein kinase YAK1